MKKIILCTGGTGGHIFPMIALYEELKKNHNVKIVTDQRALKYLDLKQDLTIIPAESPYRKKGMFHFIKSIFIIGLSVIKSFFILISYRPNVVVGSGGYVSYPILVVAKLLKIKFFIYETNSVLGRVNQIFLPHCHKLLTGYELIHSVPEKFKDKMNYVGQLVRSQFMRLSEDGKMFGKTVQKGDSLNILILGGSQGAKIFGDKLPEKFLSLSKKKVNLTINQQVQEDQLASVGKYYEKNIIASKINDKEILLTFMLFTFSNQIEQFVKKADLVICRSGSSTLSELASANKPFIAVPLKNSLDNHQYQNAKYYADQDCCWLVEENDEMSFKIEKIIENVFKTRSFLNNKVENLIKLKKGNPIQNFINQITN
jgi:UDP-N-acetylglucosamine--N-acetylmuramyl-(pentapeptide) pyrophosphoryl-undecaprenol N-acetylglucosamine transferase